MRVGEYDYGNNPVRASHILWLGRVVARGLKLDEMVGFEEDSKL
jgi:hypothetical protein